MNLGFIAERLKQARNDLQISLQEVSKATSISVQRLQDIEAGQVKPTGDDVLMLAAFYRCDYRSFLDASRPLSTQKVNTLFRRYGSELSSGDLLAIQEFLFLCEIESDLEKVLFKRKNLFSSVPVGDYFKGHGKAAARELRGVYGYKGEIPVDVYRDFRECGAHIFRRRLSNKDISGLYVNHPIAGNCILINFNEDVYRQRFSVAHEFAHSVFDSEESSHISFFTGSARYSNVDKMEIRANSFASEYLLPENVLRKLPKINSENIVIVAARLMVSCAALVKALKDLSLLNDAEAAHLRQYRVSRHVKTDPEAPKSLTENQRLRRMQLLDKGLTDYYVSLCFDAKDRDLISMGRLAEALMSEGGELAEIASIYGRSLPHGA
ncbi:hypothetical protein BWR15_19265 [Pseudomonas sp. T]|nr:hypothetical protein BWR15_19265 [Pseudomonas sp. T]